MAIRPGSFILFCFCFIIVSFCAAQISASNREVKRGLQCKKSEDCGYNEVCILRECAVDLWAWEQEVDERKFWRGLHIGLAVGLPILLLVILIICCCCSCCPCYKCCGKRKQKPKQNPRRQASLGHDNIVYDQEGNPLIVDTAQVVQVDYGATLKRHPQHQEFQMPQPPPPTPVLGWVPDPGSVLPNPYRYPQQFPGQFPGQFPNQNMQPIPLPPPQHYPNMPHYQNTPPPPYFETASAPNLNNGENKE